MISYSNRFFKTSIDKMYKFYSLFTVKLFTILTVNYNLQCVVKL